MSKKIIFLAIFFFLSSAFISYYLFKTKTEAIVTSIISLPDVGKNGALSFDQNLPKTQACPINGSLYSAQQEAWWKQHRPLGVMIENSVPARPQSGISYADTVYEAVAEGGITRFLSIFYCQNAPEVGPVRSARTYFVDFISEYGNYPLYAHVGGANASGPANALGQISSYGWDGYNDLNQFYIGFPTYWRDYSRQGHTVATEHTMYSTTSKLWAIAKTHNLTNLDKSGASWESAFTPYVFKSDASLSSRGSISNILVNFWNDPEYQVNWLYDKTNNSYLRKNGGIVSIDKDTNKPIYARNIVILYMKESHAQDGYQGNEHLLYGDKGTGKASVFLDGKKINATWSKANRVSRTLLYDLNGNEISFNRGLIWFEIVPTYSAVIAQ